MKRLKLSLLVLFLGMTVLWLLADDVLSRTYEFFALRSSMVNLTGILAMSAMSIGLLLVIRWSVVENLLGGLDKNYRLHKWLGISALMLSIAHWLWAKGPKWMVGWGWLERPARKAAGAAGASEPAGLVELLRSQRGLAESLGEWAFYAAVLLIVLALFKRFPYRWFFKTHRLLAVVYLVLVFHSVVLLKTPYWSSLIGPLMGLLLLAGSIAAILSLTGKIGKARRAVGSIETLEQHRRNRVLGVGIRLQDRWPGHEAGQFAFVTFDPAEGPHPFTISSAWHDDGHLLFNIKGIGDYTRSLPQRLRLEDMVTIEGPYGRFDFAGEQAAQVWIGGGIGITPFIARLHTLAKQPEPRSIDLYYCTSEPDELFIARLRNVAERAGVRLHILISQRDGRLSVERLCEEIPDWAAASFWFCGPAGFGQTLRDGLVARGLDAQAFHQELFDMR